MTDLTPVIDIRSGKKRKAAGTRRELQELAHWKDEGFVAFRTPASMGCCDVIAMRDFGGMDPPCAELYFVEVKANLGNPFMNFRRLDREALKVAAKLAGAVPLLVHHPPNGKRRVIPAEHWPDDGGLTAA